VDHLIQCLVNLDVGEDSIDEAVVCIKEIRGRIALQHGKGANAGSTVQGDERAFRIEQILSRVGQLCIEAGDAPLSITQVGTDPVVIGLKHGAVASIGKLLKGCPEYFELFEQAAGQGSVTLIRMLQQPPQRSYPGGHNKRKHPGGQPEQLSEEAGSAEERRTYVAELCVAHLQHNGGELPLQKLTAIPEVAEARKGVVKTFSLFLQKFPETFEVFKLEDGEGRPPRDMVRLVGVPQESPHSEFPEAKRRKVAQQTEALSPEAQQEQQETLLSYIENMCREAGGEISLQEVGQDQTVKDLRMGLKKGKLKDMLSQRPDVFVVEDYQTGSNGTMMNTMLKLQLGI